MWHYTLSQLVTLLVQNNFLHLSHINESVFWEHVLENNSELRSKFETLVVQKEMEDQEHEEIRLRNRTKEG